MGVRKTAVAWRAYRVVYQCVVKLHPRIFRVQFGEEMMWIFEEAAATHGPLRLLGDGVISLIRQWILRPRPSSVALAETASATSRGAGLFSWEHIGASPSRLPAGRWVQGGMMSLALFMGVWQAARTVTKRAPVTNLGIESNSSMHRRELGAAYSENAGATSAMDARYGNGAYAGVGPRSLRERQQRQQQLAVQVAAGARVIPGATYVTVEPQGLVPEVPKTPAGEQFSLWLRGFNSGEREQLGEARKLFKEPPGPNVDADMAFRRRTGGFDLRKIEESSATRMSGLVQERGSDQFAHFAMVVEENAPHLITQWNLDAVATPAEFAVGRLNEATAVEAAKVRIDELVKDEQFSGAVLVTKNGKPILAEAHGLADREKKIPNSLSTKFRIGSMNKMFTAVSVLQLAQAGKIKLNEPFGKYIKD
jgi:Beta-lactamase